MFEVFYSKQEAGFTIALPWSIRHVIAFIQPVLMTVSGDSVDATSLCSRLAKLHLQRILAIEL